MRKQSLILCFAALLAGFLFVSCNKDNDLPPRPSGQFIGVIGNEKVLVTEDTRVIADLSIPGCLNTLSINIKSAPIEKYLSDRNISNTLDLVNPSETTKNFLDEMGIPSGINVYQKTALQINLSNLLKLLLQLERSTKDNEFTLQLTDNEGQWLAGTLVAYTNEDGSGIEDKEEGDGNEMTNCFGIIAGKNATTDGSVLVGHNEDDGGEQMLNMYVADFGLWAEFPGMKVADAALNKWGVCVVSDACQSRENKKEFKDGGVLYEVRMAVAKNATSARDGVKIIGKLVEQKGYSGSGRTYLVADPNEGWVVSVVQGRHWVAQRVPDDQVMVIPNNYIIDQVKPYDNENFMCCADLIDYAIKRGWYKKADGEFSFKKAYGDPDNYRKPFNCIRRQSALRYLSGIDYSKDQDTHPFSFKPKKKVSIQDLRTVLSSHGQNVEEQYSNKTELGGHQECICRETTILSNIFQLRNWLPKDVGCVMWTAAGHPCVEAYFPWYLGMNKTVYGFNRFKKVQEAEAVHFSDAKDLRANYPGGLYWKFVDRWNRIVKDYDNNVEVDKEEFEYFQNFLFAVQPNVEVDFFSDPSSYLKSNSRNCEDLALVPEAYVRMYEYTQKMYRIYFKKFGMEN